MKINSPNLAYNDGYTSNMHYVRYNTESLGIASLTSDPDSQAASYGTDRSTDPITVSSDFIYQLSRVIKFTIIVIQKWWSCHFGFHRFGNQKWHSNQCCVVNEKKMSFFLLFSTLCDGSRIGGVTTTHLKKNCSRYILVYYFSTLPKNGIVTLRCLQPSHIMLVTCTTYPKVMSYYAELLQCDILFCVCGHGCARARLRNIVFVV